MPWTDIYAGLGETYGFRPWDVDRLTLYQALVYMGARDREFAKVRRTSTPEELAEYARQQGMQRHGV